MEIPCAEKQPGITVRWWGIYKNWNEQKNLKEYHKRKRIMENIRFSHHMATQLRWEI